MAGVGGLGFAQVKAVGLVERHAQRKRCAAGFTGVLIDVFIGNGDLHILRACADELRSLHRHGDSLAAARGDGFKVERVRRAVEHQVLTAGDGDHDVFDLDGLAGVREREAQVRTRSCRDGRTAVVVLRENDDGRGARNGLLVLRILGDGGEDVHAAAGAAAGELRAIVVVERQRGVNRLHLGFDLVERLDRHGDSRVAARADIVEHVVLAAHDEKRAGGFERQDGVTHGGRAGVLDVDGDGLRLARGDGRGHTVRVENGARRGDRFRRRLGVRLRLGVGHALTDGRNAVVGLIAALDNIIACRIFCTVVVNGKVKRLARVAGIGKIIECHFI